MGKHEGRRPFGRPARGWKDNIKMYLQGIVWKGMDRFTLVQHKDKRRAVVNTIMNLSFHKTPKIS